MNNNCITTYTGKHIDPLHPDPDMICIEDIAHALSLICRGNGQVKTFFSVGQHCINEDNHVGSEHHEVLFGTHIRRHYNEAASVYDCLYTLHLRWLQDSDRFYGDVPKISPLSNAETLLSGIVHIPDIPCH